MQRVLLATYAATWRLVAAQTSSAALQPLGIGGTNDQVCTSACNIGNACATVCGRTGDITADNGGICCQAGCVGWYGLCAACYDVTVGTYAHDYQDPYNTGYQGSTLQECSYAYGIVPNERLTDIWRSNSYIATSTLPADWASYISGLPSPTKVYLNVTSNGDGASTTGSALQNSGMTAPTGSTPTSTASSQTGLIATSPTTAATIAATSSAATAASATTTTAKSNGSRLRPGAPWAHLWSSAVCSIEKISGLASVLSALYAFAM